MSGKRIIAGVIVIAALATAVVFANIDAKTEEYYGLRTIREPYRGRVREAIRLALVQHTAIANSGFKVYTLNDIIQTETLKKFYVWTELGGSKFVTTHFFGTGEIFMKKGDTYLGHQSPLWLSIYRNGQEVKFTIQR